MFRDGEHHLAKPSSRLAAPAPAVDPHSAEARQTFRDQKLDAFDHKRLLRRIKSKQDDLRAESRGSLRPDPPMGLVARC